LLFAKNEKIANTLLFAKNEKNVIFIPKSGHNFVIHNFIDFLTGITTPKDGGFRSWVEALYKLTSLNMVTMYTCIHVYINEKTFGFHLYSSRFF
jgi:hypothetical protein